MTDRPAADRFLTRRTALVGVGALLTGVAATAMTPRRLDGDAFGAPLDQLVPERLGGWRSRADPTIVLPEAPGALTRQLYDKTLSRTYAEAGRPDVMLVIAHGRAQTTSFGVHRPELCYAASGFVLGPTRPAAWPLGDGAVVPGRLLTATRGERVEQIGYWRRIADAFPETRPEEQMVALRRRLSGWIPDGVLVRMSAITADRALAEATIARFADALIRGSRPEGRRMMLGSLGVALEARERASSSGGTGPLSLPATHTVS